MAGTKIDHEALEARALEIRTNVEKISDSFKKHVINKLQEEADKTGADFYKRLLEDAQGNLKKSLDAFVEVLQKSAAFFADLAEKGKVAQA